MFKRPHSSYFSKRSIFYLSIPIFFKNLAIPLVGIVDTDGRNLGQTKFLAATSIATSVIHDHLELWLLDEQSVWWHNHMAGEITGKLLEQF